MEVPGIKESKDTEKDGKPTEPNVSASENKKFLPFSFSKGLALFSIVTGYILGPLILFGLLGFAVYTRVIHNKIILVLFMGLGFCVTNWLIYAKLNQYLKKLK